MLIVSPRLPSPLGKADSRTVFHLIRYLAGRGHRVHLATFMEPGEDRDAGEDLARLCASIERVPLHPLRSKLQVALGLSSRIPMQVAYYRYGTMQAAVDRIVHTHRPTLLYAHLLRTARYLLPYANVPKVLALQISHTLNYQRLIDHTAQPLVKAFYAVEYQKIRRYEPAMVPAFDRVLLISPYDKVSLEGHERFHNVFFNPHGIEVSYYNEDLGLARVPDTLVMNGVFSVPTNVDAVLYFYRQIFPKVRGTVTGVQLWLVGRDPSRAIRRLEADPAVKVTGFVKDLRPYLQQAAVAIDPLRVGAGLQNKVLVSMAASLPVVATPVANEGIQAPDKQAILLADAPDRFADHVIRLLRDAEERRRIGTNAYNYVQQYWSWEYHFEKLETMLRQLIREGGRSKVQQYYPFKEKQDWAVLQEDR